MAAVNLSKLAVELNEAMDELNDALGAAEKALADLGLGVTAQVPFGDDKFLTFGKSGAEWMLIVQFHNGSSSPLLKASKQIRLQAVGCLQELYQKILLDAEQQVESIKTATVSVYEFANEVSLARKSTDRTGTG